MIILRYLGRCTIYLYGGFTEITDKKEILFIRYLFLILNQLMQKNSENYIFEFTYTFSL